MVQLQGQVKQGETGSKTNTSADMGGKKKELAQEGSYLISLIMIPVMLIKIFRCPLEE